MHVDADAIGPGGFNSEAYIWSGGLGWATNAKCRAEPDIQFLKAYSTLELLLLKIRIC